MKTADTEEVKRYDVKLNSLWEELEEACEILPTTDEWPSGRELREIDLDSLKLTLDDGDPGENDSEYSQAERYLYGRAVRNMAERMSRYVGERNFEKAESVWLEITHHTQHSSYPGALTPTTLESIGSLIAEIGESRPLSIYEYMPNMPSPEPRIDVPKLVVGVNDAFARSVAGDPELLYSLSPRDFERFIAEIFTGFGYEVELTAPTRDGGADIIALSRIHGISFKLLVECKRYVPPNNVGVGHVRSLLGVKQDIGANKALLATTSYFSRPALDFAERHFLDLELKNYEAIVSWSEEYAEILERIRNA